MSDLTGKRAARLLRVSSRGQDEDNQDTPTAEYITDRGMVPGPTYRLRGKSATKGQQVKAVRDAIAAAGRGEFDVLVIRAIDRLDRRGALAGWRLLGELLDADLTVLSAEPSEAFLEHIDDGTMPMVGTLISAKLDLAYEEVKAKVRRINDVFRRMDADGSFRGAIPAGYRREGEKYAKRLVPDVTGEHGHTSETVAGAIMDASTGTSTTKLGKRLGLTPEAVAKLLRNGVYSSGRYVIVSHRDCPEDAECRTGGDRSASSRCATVQHRTTPLVDPDVQARAIAGLEARRTGDNVSSRGRWKDDLSGLLWCGACSDVRDEAGNAVQDGRLYRYFSNGGNRAEDGRQYARIRRYRCRTCGKSVRADDTDTAVNQLMSERTAAWYRLVYVPGNDHSAELGRVQLELDELPRRHLPRVEMMAETSRLYDELERLAELPRIPPSTYTEVTGLTEGDRWLSLDADERRDWLNGEEFWLFVKVSGRRDGSVVVEFEYAPDDGDE